MIYPFGQIMGDKERGRLFSIQMDGSDSVPFIIKKDKVLFGRGDSCEVRIYVDGVSPEHCVITFNDEGRGFVEPVTKSCLTFLNGELIERQVSLEHNDVITIVKRSFRFFYPTSSKFYVAVQPVTNTEEITVEEHLDFDPEEAFTRRGREMQEKRVTFGPRLSPEEFDKNMPPASPLRRGSLPADKLKAKTPDIQKSHFKRALFKKVATNNSGTSVEELSRLKVLQSTSVVLQKLRCSESVEIQNRNDQSEKNTTSSRPLFSEVLKKSTKNPQKNVATNKTLQRYSPKRLAKKPLKIQNSKKTFYKSPGRPVHPRVLAVGSTGHANSPETIVIYKKRVLPSRKSVSSVKKRKSLRLVKGSLNSKNSRKSIAEKDKEDNTENHRSTPARESVSTQHNSSLDIFDSVETPEIINASLDEVYDNTPRRKSPRPHNNRDSTPSQEKDTNDNHLSNSPLAVAIDSVAQLDENSIDKSLRDIHNAVQALACHSGMSSALNNEPSSSDMCLNAVKKLALTISMVNAFHMYRRIIDDVSGFPLCFPSTSFDSNREQLRCVQRSGAHSNEDPVDIGRMFQDIMRNFFTTSIRNDAFEGGRNGMLRSCTNDLCPEVPSICSEDSRKSKYASKNKVALRVIDSACKNPRCKSVHSHDEDVDVYESDEVEKENGSVQMNESGFCSNCTPVRSNSSENSGRDSMSDNVIFFTALEPTSRSSLSQMKESSRHSTDAQISSSKKLSTPKNITLRKTRKSIALNSSSKKVAALNQIKRRLSLQPKKSPRTSLKGSRVSSKSAENSPTLKSLKKSIAARSRSSKSFENSPASTKLKSPRGRKSVGAYSKTLKSAENSPASMRNFSAKSVEVEKENDSVLMNESGFSSNSTPIRSNNCEDSDRTSSSYINVLVSGPTISQMKAFPSLRKTRNSITLNSSSEKVTALNQIKGRLSLQPNKSSRSRKSVAAYSKTLKSAENSPTSTRNFSAKSDEVEKENDSVLMNESRFSSNCTPIRSSSPALNINSAVKLKSLRKSIASKSGENSPASMRNFSAQMKSPRKSVAAESKTLKSPENSQSLIINSSGKLKSLRKSIAAESKSSKVSRVAKKQGITASKKLKEQKINQKHRLSVLKKVNYKVKSPEVKKAVKQNLKSPRILLQKNKENITLKTKQIRVSQKLLQKAKSRASTSPTVSPRTKVVLSPKLLRKRIEKRKSVVFKGLGSRSKRSDLNKTKKRKSSLANTSPKQLRKTVNRNEKTRRLSETSENDEMDMNEDKESEPAVNSRGTKRNAEAKTTTKKQKVDTESAHIMKSRKPKEKKPTKTSNRKQRSNITVDSNESNNNESLENEKVDAESLRVVKSGKAKEKKVTKSSNARMQRSNKENDSSENKKVNDHHTRKEVPVSKTNSGKKDVVTDSPTPVKETKNVRKRRGVKTSQVENEDENSTVSQETVDNNSLDKQSRSKRKLEVLKEQISEKAETPKKVRSYRKKNISELSSGNESKDLTGEAQAETSQKTKDTVLKGITKNSTTRSLRSKQSDAETTNKKSVEVDVNESQKVDRRRKEYRDSKKAAVVEDKQETVDNENQSQRATRKRKIVKDDKNGISPKKAVEISKPMGRKRRNVKDPVEETTKESSAIKDSQNRKRKDETRDENIPDEIPKRGKRKRNPVENTKDEETVVSSRSLRSRK